MESKRPVDSVLPVPLRISNDALKSGSKVHTGAKAETTGYAPAFRRAFDSLPRDRSCSSVWYPPLPRYALATRFQQWSVQRPCVSIIEYDPELVKLNRNWSLLTESCIARQCASARLPQAPKAGS
jgi:hypothetical protein